MHCTAYIYIIWCDISGKCYVGKTTTDPYKRFREHIREARKSRNKNRPLYTAIRKYGDQHFHVSSIGEYPIEEINEWEIHWIKAFGAYKTGYNGTYGGDGKLRINRDKVIKAYLKCPNAKTVAEKLNLDHGTVLKIVKNSNISPAYHFDYMQKKQGHPIRKLSEQGEILGEFPTVAEALRSIEHDYPFKNFEKNFQGNRGKISKVADGKRKTAFGFCWQWVEE